MVTEEESRKLVNNTVNDTVKKIAPYLNEYFKDASILVNQGENYFCFKHPETEHKIVEYPKLLWTYRGTEFNGVWELTFSYTGIIKLDCGETFRVGFHIHVNSNELEDVVLYFKNNKKLTEKDYLYAKLGEKSHYNFIGVGSSIYHKEPNNVINDNMPDEIYRH